MQRKEKRLPPLLNRDKEKTFGFDVSMGKNFTSFCLLTHLGVKNNWATQIN